MPTFTFDGSVKLKKKLKENITMDDIKKIVRHHGAQLQQKAQNKADFRGHWGYKDGEYRFIPPTGALKGSIGLEFENGGMTAVVEPAKEYGPYVELGTRFMDAQPYLKPAFEEQERKFRSDLDKIVR